MSRFAVEIEHHFSDIENINNCSCVQTITREDDELPPLLVVTRFAENKLYMKFSNWWDQIFLHGALPFLVLAVSNIRYAGGVSGTDSVCRESL